MGANLMYNIDIMAFMAERVGFEPTVRLLDVQPISSRPRYGHFGTSPCLKKLLEECFAFLGVNTTRNLHLVVQGSEFTSITDPKAASFVSKHQKQAALCVPLRLRLRT